MTRPNQTALLTDLYEITMAAAYWQARTGATASFELFVRRLPENRSFLIAAGLEQALEFLENFHFTGAEIDFLRKLPVFARIEDGFFRRLGDLRFTGEVWAVPEGTIVFAEEPLLRVTAPLLEAQLVETFLLSTITFQTLVATKAARLVQAAGGRSVVEFGSRRAHGPEAGVLAARAAYIGGCNGTSNVEAGARFGLPVYGTQAHSFVLTFDQEEESFRQFLKTFPDDAVLLLDTYDTLGAVDRIVAAGLRPAGVRLDSGDLARLSHEVRRRLDRAGLQQTRIIGSGDLNEERIAEILAQNAPIDSFGVGTELATSKDAPALGGVYKLVEISRSGLTRYPAKFSEEKATYPGRKQCFRFADANGMFTHDVIGRAEEDHPEAGVLLQPVLRAGKRLSPPPPLQQLQQHAREQVRNLPERYRRLHGPAEYPVEISPDLSALLEDVRRKAAETNNVPRLEPDRG